MGLRDLTSDLTSLKFNDFKSDSNPKPKPSIVKKIGKGGRNSTFDVQGILIGKRLDDIVRMAKLVVQRPGLEFMAKQAIGAFLMAHQKTQTFETNGSLFKEVVQPALDILASAVTNIGQTAVNGLGVHLNKGLLEIKGKNFRSYVGRTDGIEGDLGDEAGGRYLDVTRTGKLTLNDGTGAKGSYIDYTTGGGTPTYIGENAVKNEAPTHFNDQMIPFMFHILNNDSKDKDTYVKFHAFLTNFDDSFNASWGQVSIPGRAEGVKKYEGFQRNANFGFKIAALTREELLPTYEKLKWLASTTMPTYKDIVPYGADEVRQEYGAHPQIDTGATYMRGTIVRITLGDYLYQQPATINSVQFTWQTDYPWEIRAGRDKDKVKYNGADTKISILPQVLDVSVSADLIHDYVAQTGDMRIIGSGKLE
tara:strand:+ start:1084 stop:2343 length:1260 start_codon:yes stop_codon:yes gene_type:complete